MAFDENDREGTGAEWNVGTSIPTKVDPNEKELELAENVELAKNDENAKSITANWVDFRSIYSALEALSSAAKTC